MQTRETVNGKALVSEKAPVNGRTSLNRRTSVNRKVQLTLIDEPAADWQLDDETRRTGRRGLELAREALRQAGRRTAA